MTETYFREQFASALPYDRYIQNGTEEQRRRWTQVYETARLTGAQADLVSSFEREMKIVVFSGLWCGDCIQQCPLIQRVAEGNPKKIDLRFVERLKTVELIPELRINGGSRVPVVLFFSEDDKWCATAGDRTLNRYRALALARLGAMCRTGLFAPEQSEIDATLGDWMNEVERVQLMLRLAPRLRDKHQD